jgi:hypothetical protein
VPITNLSPQERCDADFHQIRWVTLRHFAAHSGMASARSLSCMQSRGVCPAI